MQTITIAGRIGKDAATKSTNTGNTVTEWSVAVGNGAGKDATWYKCSLWGNRGERLAQYIRRGASITVTGDLTAEVYNGKPDLKINVHQVTLQGPKADNMGQADKPGSPIDARQTFGNGGNARKPAFDDDLDDDCPF